MRYVQRRPLSLFVGVSAVVCACASVPAGNMVFPDGLEAKAAVSIGAGSGTLTAKGGVLSVSANVGGQGDYAENWRMKATVFDFKLPTPSPLPAECSRVSMRISCPESRSPKATAMLRALVMDLRGGVWAVGTRLKGGSSAVPYTRGFELIETYEWDVSELGRIDPWVMMSLEPATYDEYDPPKPPLKLVGFRLVVTSGEHFELEIKDVASTARGTVPDPYWCLTGEEIYQKRLDQNEPMRYGWGPDEAGPYLRACDLGLANGAYAITWEILSADEWSLVASRSETLMVAGPTTSIDVPLLPNGTYRLRLYVKGEKEPRGKERLFQYFVIRNSRGAPLAEPSAPPKPLRVSGVSSPVLERGVPAKLVIASADGKGTIKWNVESCDKRELLKGEAEGEAKLDLTTLAEKEPTLWITATLNSGDTVLDVIRRTIGYRSAPQPDAAHLGGPAAKMEPMMGSFRRTKGDWHEGGTSIATRHAETMEQMRGWLDEGKQIGYTMVELSAPWYDLEPLPGVQQFGYLDKLIEEAKSRGFRVVLRVHPVAGLVPSWVPRELQEDQTRRCHGIWHGGSNLIYSPASKALRDNYFHFLEVLGSHYRADPMVVGYTLTNVFFDHCLIDCPWLGQHVDFSDSMRRAYVDHLRKKYDNDLATLSAAHGTSYTNWESVEIPAATTELDAEGRVRPSSSKAALDYEDSKRGILESFRTEAMAALRRGDHACAVGPYSDQARAFLEQTFTSEKYFVPQGSMEDQFPPEALGYPVRYEPHAKVSRGALTTDIGISNTVFRKLGWNECFNYWFPQWRIETVTPDIKEAELRLKLWFAALDRAAGGKEAGESSAVRSPVLIGSLETLLYAWRHVHTARIYDYFSPYLTKAAAERVRCDLAYTAAITPEALAGRPYVYLPFSSDVIDERLAKILVDYVEKGGKLVMEWGGGWRLAGSETENALGALLGLPPAKGIVSGKDAESLAATTVKGGILDGVPVAFRVKQFKPPVETQPVAWIHTAARNYFRLCKIEGGLPKDAVTAAEFSGAPVAYVAKKGKGEILFFAGTVDWTACPGLPLRIDNWGRGRELSAAPPPDPEILVSHYAKDKTFFSIGRRFAHHSQVSKLKGGTVPDECKTPESLAVTIPAETGAKYAVRELLSGQELGEFSGDDLRKGALKLSLVRGEGFAIEATPR